MDATSLYITTCRYILNNDLNDENSGGDLYRLLPYLRQSLSCCVCTKLLNGPMGPANPTCHHHVCHGCIGGKKRLRPACGWCTDYSQFIEKKQLKILLSCYKKMCEYIADTPISRSLVGTNGGTSNALALLYEGIALHTDGTDDTNNVSYFDIMSLLQTRSNHVTTLTPKKRGRKRKKNIGIDHKNEDPKNKMEDMSSTFPKTQAKSPLQNTQLVQPLSTCCSNEVKTTRISAVKPTGGNEVKTQKYKRRSAPPASLKFMNRGRARGRLRKFRGYRPRTKSDSAITDKTMRSAAMNYAKTNTNAQKQLIISGRRAKLLREGRKLIIQQGCRCGTWSPGGGTSSTCQGRRCPCFMSGIGCASCRCRGCSNPLEVVGNIDDSKSKQSIEVDESESIVSVQSGRRSRSNSQ